MGRRKKLDPSEQEDIKGDMTPMIDIIFLLLIFFILTTKFIVPEKMISQLLPTNKGQASSSPPVVEPPQDLNILLYPEGFARGMGVEVMDTKWKNNQNSDVAMMQVSNNGPIRVVGNSISASNKEADLKIVLGEVYGYVSSLMEAAELAGLPRKEQRPVVIHCFSALSWKYAMLAYDAVRQFEKEKSQVRVTNTQDLREAREVSFAPPRVRNYHTWALGNELYEILYMR